MSSSQQLLLGEGAGGSGPANYIEDVFSTYLYTGNASFGRTIPNNIDLSTKGGLVWIKDRSSSPYPDHYLSDSSRGPTWVLRTNDTSAQENLSSGVTSFATTGFVLGDGRQNLNNINYASWTFRKQPKFFDVLTYSGTGSLQTIAHNLGSEPGCIIIKKTNAAGTNWTVYHRSLGNTRALRLNTSEAQTTSSVFWNNTSPTSTVFTVNTNTGVNESGATYVAYLYAHDAGGFGLTGTDNVITCGTFTAGASGYSGIINLGYEPQWVLLKCTSTSGNWELFDVSRLWTARGNYRYLNPNLADSESGTINNSAYVTSTGFYMDNILTANATYVYVAIRRGLMKTPTDATKVFTPIAATPSAGATATIAVTPDMLLFKGRNISDPFWIEDRLRYFALEDTSSAKQLQVNSVNAETTQLPIAYYIQSARMLWGSYLGGVSSIIYNFKRAFGFFDEVYYTGTSGARTVTHNLGVAPELIIVKQRSGAANWRTYAATQGVTQQAVVNATDSFAGAGVMWNNTAPTASVFSLGNDSEVNGSGQTYVAYLFATCPGVSKVGQYTGTGATLTISCGFSGGARFVLIKRADSNGGWYVWDTARGMTAGTDPSLRLNSVASEINANWVYTTTGGFQIVSTDVDVNTSGGTYIYMAIA